MQPRAQSVGAVWATNGCSLALANCVGVDQLTAMAELFFGERKMVDRERGGSPVERIDVNEFPGRPQIWLLGIKSWDHLTLRTRVR
jgi:hypothetical protein